MGLFGFGKKKEQTDKQVSYAQPEEVDIPNLPSDFSSDTLADLPEFPEKTEADKNKMDDLETLPMEDELSTTKPSVQPEKEEGSVDDFFAGVEEQNDKDDPDMMTPRKPMSMEKPSMSGPMKSNMPEPNVMEESSMPGPSMMKQPVSEMSHPKEEVMSAPKIMPTHEESMSSFHREESSKKPGLTKIDSEYFLDAESFSEVMNILAELQINSRKLKNRHEWNELTEKEAELLDALEETADAVQKKLVSTDTLLVKR